jgi:hypothetical protein
LLGSGREDRRDERTSGNSVRGSFRTRSGRSIDVICMSSGSVHIDVLAGSFDWESCCAQEFPGLLTERDLGMEPAGERCDGLRGDWGVSSGETDERRV